MRGGVLTRGKPVPWAVLDDSGATPFYQDSARTTLAVADNDPVGSWTYTNTGSGGPSQATAANRPVLKTNVLNGHSVVQFDGVNDVLDAVIGAVTAQTHFIVCRKLSAPTSTSKAVLGLRQTSSIRNALLCNSVSVSPTEWGWFSNEAATTVVLPGLGATAWQIIALNFASLSAATAYANGGAAVAFDPSDTEGVSVNMSLGANGITTGFADVQIATHVRFLSSLSVGNVDYVGHELAAKYGLTWASAA